MYLVSLVIEWQEVSSNIQHCLSNLNNLSYCYSIQLFLGKQQQEFKQRKTFWPPSVWTHSIEPFIGVLYSISLAESWDDPGIFPISHSPLYSQCDASVQTNSVSIKSSLFHFYSFFNIKWKCFMLSNAQFKLCNWLM